MSARSKPKKVSKRFVARALAQYRLARMLEQAENAIRFGMFLFIKAHDPNVKNPAEVKLQALVNLEDAASKIGVARQLRAARIT